MHTRATYVAEQVWIPHKLCLVGEGEPSLESNEAYKDARKMNMRLEFFLRLVMNVSSLWHYMVGNVRLTHRTSRSHHDTCLSQPSYGRSITWGWPPCRPSCGGLNLLVFIVWLWHSPPLKLVMIFDDLLKGTIASWIVTYCNRREYSHTSSTQPIYLWPNPTDLIRECHSACTTCHTMNTFARSNYAWVARVAMDHGSSFLFPFCLTPIRLFSLWFWY